MSENALVQRRFMEMGMVETESMSRMMDSEKSVGSVTEALVELWNGFLEC